MKNKSLIIVLIIIAVVAGVIYCMSQRVSVRSESSLAIPGLGVSIPLTSGISDLIYYGADGDAYGLSTESLTSAPRSSEVGICGAEVGALGFLSLSERSEVELETSLAVKLAEGSYLVWVRPQDRCADDAGVQAMQNEQLELVQEAVKKAYRN